ncbi:uncharacterized protein LOC117157361 isoform X1 [Bombus vancouverensis nearcticus]|uniref:uncharacterized protein LOC117157361 isoform X1 n=1 Tax=Bombus vancouverensis nearcticus TaxID=2705178 RepID=UPI00143B0723|nr:uncharacterized protein LOC117157361 isoform X1 [Bombus vancouverensis nearcticus]
MTSIESNKVTNVEVQNGTNTSTSQVITTNNDQNPNTSTIAKVDGETVVSSDLFAYDPAKYSFCREKSIVNILKVGELGTLEFLEEIRKDVYAIAIWPTSAASDYEELLDQLDIVIPEATQWKNRRPNIGDFVFGQRLDGDWVRGYVICVLPFLKLAMVDETKLVLVSNLATCEKPLSDMYAFSGVCELTDATHKFKEGQDYRFKVTGRTDKEKPDKFEILILKGHFELKATVKPWIPTPEQLGVPCGHVNYGTTVCVTGYRNHIHMYVRPLDTLGLARYNFIMETVAKCAETSPFLKEPNIGQSVLALSADGNYYRAFITKVQEDRAHVMYHDLGRREYVDRKKLRIFPDYLKKLGYCISKILLQGIPKDIPPLISIIEILDSLVENKVPLICTYDGIPSTEGVYLKYPDGESVNNMICKCIEPYRVKPPE